MEADDFITRLKTHCALCKLVAGAAGFANAEAQLRNKIPAAFVLPLAESAEANELSSGISQRVAQRFGVVLAVSNHRDAGGEAALGDLAPVRSAVMTALLGWAVDGNHDPVEFAGGRLVDLSQGVLWWQDDFLTRFHVRA